MLILYVCSCGHCGTNRGNSAAARRKRFQNMEIETQISYRCKRPALTVPIYNGGVFFEQNDRIARALENYFIGGKPMLFLEHIYIDFKQDW